MSAAATGPARSDGAARSLARVLGYVGAVAIEPASRRITVDRAAVGLDELATDPRFVAGAAEVLAAIADYLSS